MHRCIVVFLFLLSSCFQKKIFDSYPSIISVLNTDGYYRVILGETESHYIQDFDAAPGTTVYSSITGKIIYQTSDGVNVELDPVEQTPLAGSTLEGDFHVVYRISSSNHYNTKYVRYVFLRIYPDMYIFKRLVDTYPIFNIYQDVPTRVISATEDMVTLFEF